MVFKSTKGHDMAYTADQIIGFCEAEWDVWKSDCSGFVKAVGKRLGIQLTGQANTIIDFLESSNAWQNLSADQRQATLYATQDYFVVGGLKAAPHGHLVVVVKSAPQAYAVAYWGRLGGTGRKNTTINWSWTHADLPNVHFYATKR